MVQVGVYHSILAIAKRNSPAKASIILQVPEIKQAFRFSRCVFIKLKWLLVKSITDTVKIHTARYSIEFIRKYPVRNHNTVLFWNSLPNKKSIKQIYCVKRIADILY